MVSLFFFSFGPIQGHKKKVQQQLGGRFEKILFYLFIYLFIFSAFTPNVKKPLGLISTFAPIGMLDLG
jgi:hypothetical protein